MVRRIRFERLPDGTASATDTQTGTRLGTGELSPDGTRFRPFTAAEIVQRMDVLTTQAFGVGAVREEQGDD